MKILFLPAIGLFALQSHQTLTASDSFATATVLTGATATSTENNQAATEESGEPKYRISFTNVSYRSLWWKWTAPASGRAVCDLTGSDPFSKSWGIYIAKGTTPQVSSLAVVDWYTGGGALNIPVVAGTVYYFQVISSNANEYGNIKINIGLDSASNLSQLNIQGTANFANDNFAQRAVLTGRNPSSIAHNYNATLEPGRADASLGDRTMWWSWTAPAHGRLAISLTGSDYGNDVGVFLGTELSNLKALHLQSVNNSGDALKLPVTQGQTYIIGTGADNVNFLGSEVLTLNLDTATDINQLSIRSAASVDNDLFANRIELRGASVSAIGYAQYATLEPLEPSTAGFGTIWWTYTAPAAGTVSLATTGSDSENSKYISVWTGNAVSALTPVVRSAGAVSPTVSFPATAGTTYQISVGATGVFGTAKPTGDIVLTLSGPPGSPVDSPISGLAIDNAVRLRWPTAAGSSYRLNGSSNLQDWTTIGDVIFGDGSVKEVYQPVTAGSRFFRIMSQ